MNSTINLSESKVMQAQTAIKNECKAPSLPCLIKYFQKEKSTIEAELNRMPADAWFNVRARQLMNREQELHTTLNVLRELANAPIQIAEPTQ